MDSLVRRRRRRTAVTASVLGCVLALAACGSDDGGGTGSGATQQAHAAGLTGAPVKIGVAAGLTGASASLTTAAAQVTTAWGKFAEAQGGIAGRPVELVVRDTKGEPAAGLAAAKELVNSDHVVAVIVLETIAEAPILQYLQTTDVPVIGVPFSQGVGGKLKNVFSTSTSLEGFVPGIFVAAKAAGKQNVGNAYCAESPICAQAVTAYKPIAESLAINYVGGAKVSASAPSYTAECLQLIGEKIDFLELDLASATGQRVAQTCIQQGYQGTFGAPAAAMVLKDLTKVSGATFAGAMHGFPWWVDAAPVAQFRDAMKQYAPDLDYRTPTATAVWAGLELFRKTLTNATGDITAASVVAAYGTVRDETLNGLLPNPVSFTANQPGPVISCFWLYSYKAGDETPTFLPAQGNSGNGQTGDLRTSCFPEK